ncbi:MAG TPA: cytochrome b/b6 domain-containing protein [Xanthobacteraceae bacterium]|jgi:cytochrome b561|nr:cytochrome b/b6 domain-containing protein [Xanthobacteraceae bacterium]
MVETAPAQCYTVTARTLHWITASLVLFMLPLGLVIANNWGGPLQDWLYNLHRSIGALLIPIVWIRVIYRLGHAPPRLPDDIPPLQQLAASTTHWALYALLIVQPFVGWIGVSAYPATITVFGLFDLPSLWHEDRAFSNQVLFVHSLIGLAIAVLAAAHIAAALHHHFIRRDGILARMTTG